MKKRIAGAVILATTLVSQGAFAKTLEDVLKEKGVITEEDYKEVNKSRPVEYKLGDGFTFTSPDEKFRLSTGTKLQARFTFTDRDSVNNPALNDISEWRVRRFEWFMKGYFLTKDLTFKTEVNFAETTNSPANTQRLLEEAYLSYRLIDEAQVQMGQYKVPFVRQELTSSGALQFVERSNATDTFKADYDPGLMLYGKIAGGLVNYNVGVFNGLGRNILRTTNNNEFVARIVCNPLGDMPYSEADLDYSEKPLVSVGASYLNDTLQKTAGAFENNNLSFAGGSGWLGKGVGTFNATEKVDINTFEVDAAFKWLGFSAQGEYIAGQGDGQISKKTLRAHGFYAQAGYFVIPKHLELAARFSYVDPNRDLPNDHQIETTGAVSYYFNKHNLKLQADYTNIHKQVATAGQKSTDDGQFRLQAQIIF